MPKPNHYVVAQLGPLVDAARDLKCPRLLVWLYLEYEWRLTKRRWVEVTNVEMAKWGVGRQAKRSALRRLEAAGMIQIEQRGHRSPRVARTGLSLRRTPSVTEAYT
jgi:hypothetical protein